MIPDPPCGEARAGDRLEIHDLYGRYVHSLRRDDAAGLANCFTADASLWLGAERMDGREQIRDLLVSLAPGRPRHHTSDLWISLAGAREARCLAHVLLLDRNTGANVAFGSYSDIAVLEPDGHWRWRERRIELDWTSQSYRERGRR